MTDTALVLTIVVVGAGVASAVLWRTMSSVFSSPVLQRQNYAGRQLPVGSGLVVVLAVLAVQGGSALMLRALVDDPIDGQFAEAFFAVVYVMPAWIVLALGFGLLGIVDDLVGDADRRGFAGHLGALLHGRVTTGMVKLAGGVFVAYFVTQQYSVIGNESAVAGVRGALVVAATANLGNLFDRAPGRTIKMSLVGFGVVALLGTSYGVAAGTGLVIAAGVGVLWPDLRERCMLGDTGSNVLGAAIGLGLVSSVDATGQWVALAVVVGLNLLSEKVSFSRVIDATPPLRWLDRLGSLR